MTTNSIIQLARFNSTNKPNNAEWTTSIREPVIINQGDTITVRQAFVDSRLNSSTNIVIDVDTTLSLTYYFYVMMPCDKMSWQEADVLQSEAHAVYPESATLNLSSDTWYYTATDYVAFAGPNGGATPMMERLQKPINTFETGRSYPVSPQNGLGGFWEWSAPINQCDASEIPMLLITNDISGVGQPMANTPITKTWTYVLKAGSYAPADLADILTKNMAEIQTNKMNDSYSPYDLFGGAQPSNLNAFLQKGTVVDSVLDYEIDDPTSMPAIFLNDRYTGDNLVAGGNMLFSSNSPAFAAQPQHTGTFSNFLIDTPFNTNYLDANFHGFYGDFYTDSSNNLVKQFTNPVMFMPSHYAGTIATSTSVQVILPPNPPPPAITFANWYKTYNSAVVGASEISLEYNPETSLFQFTYMHTPLQELPLTEGTTTGTASEPVEVVKIVKTVNANTQGRSNNFNTGNSQFADGEVKLCEQTRHSGVFFQSMEPAGFWQNIMGFDVPNITVPVEKVWGLNRTLTFSEFNKITTSGYVGIENNFNTSMTSMATTTGQTVVVPNKNAPSYISPFPTVSNTSSPNAGVFTYTQLLNSDEWILENYVLHNDRTTATGFPGFGQFYYDYGGIAGPQSDFYEEYSSSLNATNPLQAIQIPLSATNGSGHYFVEIVGYNNNINDFINENSIYAIKSIVASYYVSPNSFITQPFSDGAVYEHIGDSQYINSFKVRLLDPLTMLPASPLGPNSSVYLQLGKQMTKLSLTQPT